MQEDVTEDLVEDLIKFLDDFSDGVLLVESRSSSTIDKGVGECVFKSRNDALSEALDSLARSLDINGN